MSFNLANEQEKKQYFQTQEITYVLRVNWSFVFFPHVKENKDLYYTHEPWNICGYITNVPKKFDSKYQELQASTNVYNLHDEEGQLFGLQSTICLRFQCKPSCEHQLGTQKSESRLRPRQELSFSQLHLLPLSLFFCLNQFPSDPFSLLVLFHWSIWFLPCYSNLHFWEKINKVCTFYYNVIIKIFCVLWY